MTKNCVFQRVPPLKFAYTENFRVCRPKMDIIKHTKEGPFGWRGCRIPEEVGLLLLINSMRVKVLANQIFWNFVS